MDMFSLKNKVAVVTGGGSGIGLATARRFVAAGAKVVIANRTDSIDLAASFGATYIKTDVGVEADVAALMKETAERHERIDIIVNNAGYGRVGPMIQDGTSEDMELHLRINLLGVFYGIKYGVPFMKNGGSIVNVSSLAGVFGMPTYAPYASSKWGVIGLTKSAALELGGQGIRVNAVCPGTIDTPMNQQGGAEAEYELVKYTTALGRAGTPEEVAALIHFLAADDCMYLTGEAIVVDGGWGAGPTLAMMEKVLS
ncbi:MAG: SDR family NAD(P)-dependent oxidoreductase [Proteobacteria bacterium]|nr:SDR family NAD(P)-dependent oxidoreductase [Pseudomonadota bacterium]